MREVKRFAVRAGPKRELQKRDVKRLGKQAPPEDPEEMTKADLDETQQALKAALEAITASFREELDTEYWVCAVFQTREQKMAFLEKLAGWNVEQDGDKYVNGLKLASLMKIEVPPTPKWKPAPTPRARWTRLARQHGDKD